MIRFGCPSCGTAISAPEATAGRTAQCPKCKWPVQVPVAVQATPDVFSDLDTGDPVARLRRRRLFHKIRVLGCLGLLGTLALVVAGGVYYFGFGGKAFVSQNVLGYAGEKALVLDYIRANDKTITELTPLEWAKPERVLINTAKDAYNDLGMINKDSKGEFKPGVILHVKYKARVGLSDLVGESVFLIQDGKVVGAGSVDTYGNAVSYERALTLARSRLGAIKNDSP